MRLREIDEDWPLVLRFLPRVVADLDGRGVRRSNPPTVSRRVVLETFEATRNVRHTAARTGLSVTRVGQIIVKAIFLAREMAGLPRVPGRDD